MIRSKLVRNKVPDLMMCPYTVRTLGDSEFFLLLLDKLDEEVGEFKGNPCLEELADIAEVVQAFAYYIATPQMLEQARQAKANERGTFGNRLLMTWSERDQS